MKIYSLNVRGLNDKNKRKSILSYFQQTKAHVVLLQETHLCEEDHALWEKEWSSTIYYSTGQSNARGVAILVSGSLDCLVENVNTDGNGRLVCV